MTLAERLLAIQAEYRSACAEAADLKRRAADRSPALLDTLDTAARCGDGVDHDIQTERIAEEVAGLRDRADAISERASELKAQIIEIETHLRETQATSLDGILGQIQTLQERIQRLENPATGGLDQAAENELNALQGSMKQLREEYLRGRIEALARSYLVIAHQLVETGTQLKALCGIAEQHGNPLQVQLRNLEIPLPFTNQPARWDLEAKGLSMDNQRILDMQAALNEQLSAVLHY